MGVLRIFGGAELNIHVCFFDDILVGVSLTK